MINLQRISLLPSLQGQTLRATLPDHIDWDTDDDCCADLRRCPESGGIDYSNSDRWFRMFDSYRVV